MLRCHWLRNAEWALGTNVAPVISKTGEGCCLEGRPFSPHACPPFVLEPEHWSRDPGTVERIDRSFLSVPNLERKKGVFRVPNEPNSGSQILPKSWRWYKSHVELRGVAQTYLDKPLTSHNPVQSERSRVASESGNLWSEAPRNLQLALDPCLIYDTCFVRRRNGGRQRNQPREHQVVSLGWFRCLPPFLRLTKQCIVDQTGVQC